MRALSRSPARAAAAYVGYPAISLAVAAPSATASVEAITLIWAPSSVAFSQKAILLVTIPAGSPQVGQAGELRILGQSDPGYVTTYLPPWRETFPNSLTFQTIVPPSNSLPTGKHVFEMRFWRNYPGTFSVFRGIDRRLGDPRESHRRITVNYGHRLSRRVSIVFNRTAITAERPS